VNEGTQAASIEYGDDNSWNCRSDNLPPRICVTGRADLPLAVCAGQHASVGSSTLDQPTAAGSGTTSQRTAPRQRYTQSYDSGSSQNEMLVRSQFDDLSVCTHDDGKNDFLHCRNDDGKTERTCSRQIAARMGNHPPPPGRSHSQPSPARGLVSDSQDTIANYRTEMRAFGTENVDNYVRPRPVQPSPSLQCVDWLGTSWAHSQLIRAYSLRMHSSLINCLLCVFCSHTHRLCSDKTRHNCGRRAKRTHPGLRALSLHSQLGTR